MVSIAVDRLLGVLVFLLVCIALVEGLFGGGIHACHCSSWVYCRIKVVGGGIKAGPSCWGEFFC